MVVFKVGFGLFSISYVITLCSHFVYVKYLETILAMFYIMSGAIAMKIMLDRHLQTNILCSLTTNPKVTSFANRVASLSASLLCVGFLVHLLMFVFEIDQYSQIAINIFICGFGTLYLWMQCTITLFFSSLYYDKKVAILRNCGAGLSAILLVVMSIIGTISTLLPRSATVQSKINFCLFVTYACTYVIIGIFCALILTFEREYKYFTGELHSDLILNEECNVSSLCSATNANLVCGIQDLPTNSVFVNNTRNEKKIS